MIKRYKVSFKKAGKQIERVVSQPKALFLTKLYGKQKGFRAVKSSISSAKNYLSGKKEFYLKEKKKTDAWLKTSEGQTLTGIIGGGTSVIKGFGVGRAFLKGPGLKGVQANIRLRFPNFIPSKDKILIKRTVYNRLNPEGKSKLVTPSIVRGRFIRRRRNPITEVMAKIDKRKMPRPHKIEVREGLKPLQQLRTLMHEVGHGIQDELRDIPLKKFPTGSQLPNIREINPEKFAIKFAHFALGTTKNLKEINHWKNIVTLSPIKKFLGKPMIDYLLKYR